MAPVQLLKICLAAEHLKKLGVDSNHWRLCKGQPLLLNQGFLVALKRTEGQLLGLLVWTCSMNATFSAGKVQHLLVWQKAITTAVPNSVAPFFRWLSACISSLCWGAKWEHYGVAFVCFSHLWWPSWMSGRQRSRKTGWELVCSLEKKRKITLRWWLCRAPQASKKKNIRGISFVCSTCSHVYKHNCTNTFFRLLTKACFLLVS